MFSKEHMEGKWRHDSFEILPWGGLEKSILPAKAYISGRAARERTLLIQPRLWEHLHGSPEQTSSDIQSQIASSTADKVSYCNIDVFC